MTIINNIPLDYSETPVSLQFQFSAVFKKNFFAFPS